MLISFFFFCVLQMHYTFQGVNFFLSYLEYIMFVFVDSYLSSVLENSVIVSSIVPVLYFLHSLLGIWFDACWTFLFYHLGLLISLSYFLFIFCVVINYVHQCLKCCFNNIYISTILYFQNFICLFKKICWSL